MYARTVSDDEPRVGRPRDPSREAAILAATLDLLGEVGYEQVTVRAIAQRAGAGLATLYRRWDSKEELVVDAVSNYRDFTPEPAPDEEPVETLVRLVSGLLDILQGTHRGLIPNLIGQMPRNPELAEELRSRVIFPRIEAVVERLGSIPGVDPERVAAAAESIPSSLFFQVLALGRKVPESEVRRLVGSAIAAARGD